MVTQHCGGQPHTQDLGSKLEDITTAARPHLTNGEIKGLEELLTEYEDIFAEANEDYGRTNKVYRRIDTGDGRPFRQPPRRIPLTKQTVVKETLDKMKRHGVIEESESHWLSPSFWSG
jgi:predicted ArsR family transcriptional regulator